VALLRGILFDVTLQRLTTIELERQVSLFQAVFTTVPDPLAIANAERIVQAVNPAFERVFGYQSEEVVGRTSAFLLAGERDWGRLGTERFNSDAIDSSAQDEPPVYADFRRKNGETFPGETYGNAIRDGQGQTLGFLGVMHDATRDHRVQLELRANETRF
jgi:PAS domain S-box-containing protein